MPTKTKTQAGERTHAGYYLLSPKLAPVGANRVEFQIRGDEVNINYAGWRKAEAGEIAKLQATKAGERTQHTPGPWRWWDRKSGRPTNYDLAKLISGDDDQSGTQILTVYGGEGNDALGRSKTDRANARLIAAAPETKAQRDDLLEVLNSILAEVERLRPDAPSRTMAYHACAPELRHFIKVKARAAIARAEGRAA